MGRYRKAFKRAESMEKLKWAEKLYQEKLREYGEKERNELDRVERRICRKKKLLDQKYEEEQDEIRYVDMASMISALSGNIMDAITIVLIAFSSISLVVSSIMIGIITYISVLERTKEIGILRALGYTQFQCAFKYLFYAFSATLIGCMIGSIIGTLTFPKIIWGAK